jgi:tetratricopeptide (TPR) repeat protein
VGAVAHGWTLILSEALRLLGDAARRQGDLTRAANLYGHCVGLLDQLDNPHGPAASLWGLGDVHRQRAALDEALQALARSRDLYREIGDHHGVADHLIGVADVAWAARLAAAAARRQGEEVRALAAEAL